MKNKLPEGLWPSAEFYEELGFTDESDMGGNYLGAKKTNSMLVTVCGPECEYPTDPKKIVVCLDDGYNGAIAVYEVAYYGETAVVLFKKFLMNLLEN